MRPAPPRRALRWDPAALLPVLHHLVLGFSRHVALEVKEGGFDLSAKSDLRFVEGAWRAFGDVLGLRPALTPRQFLAGGFAERKVLLLTDVATRCVELHNDAVRQKRLSAVKLRPETPPPSTGPSRRTGSRNRSQRRTSPARAPPRPGRRGRGGAPSAPRARGRAWTRQRPGPPRERRRPPVA